MYINGNIGSFWWKIWLYRTKLERIKREKIFKSLEEQWYFTPREM